MIWLKYWWLYITKIKDHQTQIILLADLNDVHSDEIIYSIYQISIYIYCCIRINNIQFVVCNMIVLCRSIKKKD